MHNVLLLLHIPYSNTAQYDFVKWNVFHTLIVVEQLWYRELLVVLAVLYFFVAILSD